MFKVKILDVWMKIFPRKLQENQKLKVEILRFTLEFPRGRVANLNFFGYFWGVGGWSVEV